MKIVTIVGARPQFVKAAPMSRALRENYEECLVHTGQHYDYEMSRVFFDGLDIPPPDINLAVGSGGHAKQTGDMLTGIADVLSAQLPDVVLVYGDTNSTVAGAIAAAQLKIPVAHVEAGLRSFNRAMPEEINRILTDRLADLLLCPTTTAVTNLRNEGIERGVELTGDVMYDVAAWARQRVPEHRAATTAFQYVGDNPYVLATVHRAGNVDSADALRRIVDAFVDMPFHVLWPLHPRARQKLTQFGLLDRLTDVPTIHILPPLGYMDFLSALIHAEAVLSDSGGVQKEACFHKVPCVTLRDETEWVETVATGWNVLAGTDSQRILTCLQQALTQSRTVDTSADLQDGKASQRICEYLERWIAARQPLSVSARDLTPFSAKAAVRV